LEVTDTDKKIIDQFHGSRRGPQSFEKMRLIGKGGVGRVYLVRLKDTDQLFAMKVLKKNDMIARNKVRCVYLIQPVSLTLLFR